MSFIESSSCYTESRLLFTAEWKTDTLKDDRSALLLHKNCSFWCRNRQKTSKSLLSFVITLLMSFLISLCIWSSCEHLCAYDLVWTFATSHWLLADLLLVNEVIKSLISYHDTLNQYRCICTHIHASFFVPHAYFVGCDSQFSSLCSLPHKGHV